MRTTTTTYKFTPEASPEDLSAKITQFNGQAKPGLINFFNLHGITADNLVSDQADNSTGIRTVIREWSNIETASAWATTCLSTVYHDNTNNAYPGQIISAEVNPE